MVYHYTTIGTLFSQLSALKTFDNEDYLTFWASNILHQNDLKEFSLKPNDLLEILQEIENESEMQKKIDYLKKLSHLPKECILFGKSFEEVVQDIVSHANAENLYTLSFSRIEDKLLMWSMYAHNGTGICLAFDESKLSFSQNGLLFLPNKVYYDNDEQSYKSVFRDAYNFYLDKVEDTYLYNDIYREKVYILVG